MTAYITQMTNLEISDKNPLEYITDCDTNPNFEKVIESHLLPREIIEWARMEKMPSDALDQFIEKRIDLIIDELKSNLKGIGFEIIDTQEKN